MATYLYRKDCPKGRVFNIEEEVKKALADGWVDAPDKVNEQPATGAKTLHLNEPAASGHEKHEGQKGK